MTNSLFSRFGVINWDCSRPSQSSYFGYYAARSLSPRQFRDRTPYYAAETAPDTLLYRPRTLADYEQEMRHAIAAHIDYFAYCWYDRTPHSDHVLPVTEAATCCDNTVCELTAARLFHLQSPLRSQLNLCAILITCHPYTTDELAALALTMQEPCYEKIDGRPLVYLFASPWQELLARLRECCRQAHTPDPYAVLMADHASPADAAAVQAISSYAGCCVRARTWDEFAAAELERNNVRSQSGLPVIPHFSFGWNPTPRVLHPVPWTAYPSGDYPAPATLPQLRTAAARLKEWTAAHADLCPTGHLLTFAWNEFEEGAWICPTLTPHPDAPDTHYRDAFAELTRFWRE